MLTAPKLVGHQVPSSTTYSFTQIDKTKGNLNKTAYTQKERQKNNDLIAVFCLVTHRGGTAGDKNDSVTVNT